MTSRTDHTRRPSTVAFALAAGAVLALSAPQDAAAQNITPAMKKLLQAAKSEGTLKLSWGTTSFGGGRGMAKVMKGFNKYFGTNHKLNFTPGVPSFSRQAKKLSEEVKAGRKNFSDLALGGTGQVGFFLRDKTLKPVDWGPLLPHVSKDLLKVIVSSDNSFISVLTNDTGILYNTRLVKASEAPKTLKDVLNPKWKGKVASTPYAAGFGPLGDDRLWGKEKALTYARALTGQLGGLMGCGELDRVTSGEFWIFVVHCTGPTARRAAAKGAPLAMNIPLDVLTIYHWFMGVPQLAPNPNLATMTLAYMMSPDGQKILFDIHGADLHYFPGSQAMKIYEKASKEAGKPLYPYSIEAVTKMKHKKLQRQIAKMFRETRKKK